MVNRKSISLQKLAAQRDAAGPGVSFFNTDAAASCAALSRNSRHNATRRVREFRFSIRTPPRPVPLILAFLVAGVTAQERKSYDGVWEGKFKDSIFCVLRIEAGDKI